MATSVLKCDTCNEPFKEQQQQEEDDEIFQCDMCDSSYHIKCQKVKKSDVKAKKASKRIRIFCKECEESQESSVMKKVLELVKVVYKIDMTIQERKPAEKSNEDIILSIANKLVVIEEKVSMLEKKSISVPSSNNAQKPSYAKVVQSNNIKPAVVIKPKQKQHSKKTMEEIAKTVDKSQLKVCSTRNVRNGGIVLCCDNKTETMKVKQMVRDKLGDEYDVVLPAIKNPRLRITNVDPDIPDAIIIDELKKNNEEINEFEMELVTIIPKKMRGSISNDIIVEVNSNIYKNLLELGVLSLPWRECRIFEHFYLKRCFKCCGFSHIAAECKNDQCCSKCGGNHKHNNCRSNKICCVNCKTANNQYNSSLDTRHHAWSKDCAIIQRRITRLRTKIEYNAAD